MSDFSLMDAIECGIVKLPRVPVADNIPGEEMPKFRNLWEHIGKRMPKKGRSKAAKLDPLSLPVELQTALEALYGHYDKTFKLWDEAGINVPLCFIIVCNNTSTSKLVYDYVSGFLQDNPDDTQTLQNGRLELFRNYDKHGNRLARPRTLLIDSEQLESGEALDDNFLDIASDEIERLRREITERTGDSQSAEKIDDAAILGEVMNTGSGEVRAKLANRAGAPGRRRECFHGTAVLRRLEQATDFSQTTYEHELRGAKSGAFAAVLKIY